MGKVFIYALCEPLTLRVRYIGKTVNLNKRIQDHVIDSKCNNRRRHVSRWIRSLLAKGVNPIMNVIEVCCQDNWKDRERYWIGFYRGLYTDLCNHSDGGGGGSKGALSVEAKQKLSDMARRLFSKYSEDDKAMLWGLMRDNSLQDAQKIDSRITRRLYSDVSRGEVWNGITGLPKPAKRGVSIKEAHPSAKLNMDIVSEIRRSYQKRKITLKMLASQYNISIPQVAKIVNNARWKI